MNQLDQLKQAIVKAVPEIVKNQIINYGKDVVFSYKSSPSFFWKELSKNAHEAITKEKIQNKMALTIKNKHIEIEEEFTNGRPIRLSDMLVALEGITINKINREKLLITIGGKIENGWCHWDLTDDNLDHQSPETIAFIHSILI